MTILLESDITITNI